MDSPEFNTIVNDFFEHCKEVLTDKATDYATQDRLFNFKSLERPDGSGTTRWQDWQSHINKQFIAVQNAIARNAMEPQRSTSESQQLFERLTDIVNYGVLGVAILVEQDRDVANVFVQNSPAIQPEITEDMKRDHATSTEEKPTPLFRRAKDNEPF